VRVAVALLAALALAAPAFAGARPSAGEIETELVCPVCHETLDQSTAPIAQEMKAEIRARIAQGWTKKQIIDEMVKNFGPQVLSTPAKHGFDLLAWLLPIVGVLGGAAVLGVLAWRWTREREPEPATQRWSLNGHPLGPEEERRLDEELARFDG
jgi:cytochrome c-type biogenesis protein CcmH